MIDLAQLVILLLYFLIIVGAFYYYSSYCDDGDQEEEKRVNPVLRDRERESNTLPLVVGTLRVSARAGIN